MDDFLKTIGDVLSAIAPTIATALGGPLAGAAVGAIVSALGLPPDTPPEQVAAAVAKADPDTLLKLKQAEQTFNAQMKQLEVDVVRLANDDRANAREREVKTGDVTPKVLAVLITTGFFGVLAYMLAYGVPAKGGEALLVLLGALGGAWGAVVNYYFGSSKGSDAKTEAMARAIAR